MDRYVGCLILAVLGFALAFKRAFAPRRSAPGDICLVVCFGAIGDLIILTEAVKSQLADKRVYLVCSSLNAPCARLFENFYAGIEVVNLKDLFAVHNACQKFSVTQVFDSTQWANVGPIQVGIATLLGKSLQATGFDTASFWRNRVYSRVVPHSRTIHELGNFVNLFAGRPTLTSNAALPDVVPRLYADRDLRRTDKLLFHMWPSGNRAYLKAWPETYWQELIHCCVGLGYTVYLSGAPADKVATEAFARKLNLANVVNIAGAYDLKALSAFVANEIEFIVSVNTGILHLAVMSGVPVIGLHGPTDPVRWGPLGNRSISLLPESGRSAYLHYGFEYPVNDAEAYSLDKLTVALVVAAIERLCSETRHDLV